MDFILEQHFSMVTLHLSNLSHTHVRLSATKEIEEVMFSLS
jgi:hypothetical protein